MTLLIKSFGVAFFSAFIGLLLGLSVSPVVGVVIGTLAASITAILGVLKKDKIKMLSLDYLLIGVFGLFGMIGVLLGLEFRTGQIFSDNLSYKQNKWLQVVQDSTLVGNVLIFEETGLVIDPRMKLDDRQGSLASRSNVLFSGGATVTDKLNPEGFDKSDEVYRAWKEEGHPWNIYADRIYRTFQESEHMDKFKTVWIILKN